MVAYKKEQEHQTVTDKLNDEENLDSLLYLVDKLPELAKAVEKMDELLTFTKSTLNDKKSMNTIFGKAEEKLEATGLNGDTLQATIRMGQLLPTLVPLMEKLVDVSVFITETMEDKQSLNTLLNGIAPVDETVAVLKETNERYQQNQELPHVSMFKLLKLLKDPTVRKGYKYLTTLLNVIDEKK